MKIKLISPLYLLSLCISFPLLWCSSRSLREEYRPKLQKSWKRRLLLLRVLAKQGAHELGSLILWFMFVPAVLATALLQSPFGGAIGAAMGFFAFTLIPVLLPTPSRVIADLGA